MPQLLSRNISNLIPISNLRGFKIHKKSEKTCSSTEINVNLDLKLVETYVSANSQLYKLQILAFRYFNEITPERILTTNLIIVDYLSLFPIDKSRTYFYLLN